MKKELLLFFVLFIAINFVNGEVDKSYECLKSVVAKMTNTSCPLITPEVERNLDDYARLFTACSKGYYLINGCNESEWVHACTRRVANIPNFSSSESLRGMQDIGPMWKYCNKDVKDPDFECLEKVVKTMNKESCPDLANLAGLDQRRIGKLSTACLKSHYQNYGCDQTQWVRVCNRQMDRLNVGANGGQEVIDMLRSNCDESPAYDCFEKAIRHMDGASCPEVTYARSQNDTEEHIVRHQTACYKRLYINQECNIADWKKVCNLFSFTFKRSESEKGDFMRKYCAV